MKGCCCCCCCLETGKQKSLLTWETGLLNTFADKEWWWYLGFVKRKCKRNLRLKKDEGFDWLNKARRSHGITITRFIESFSVTTPHHSLITEILFFFLKKIKITWPLRTKWSVHASSFCVWLCQNFFFI